MQLESSSPAWTLTTLDLVGNSEGFRSLRKDEEVEFTISDNGGKSKAVDVTGPGGQRSGCAEGLVRKDL